VERDHPSLRRPAGHLTAAREVMDAPGWMLGRHAVMPTSYTFTDRRYVVADDNWLCHECVQRP
jgi:hypothetical protein